MKTESTIKPVKQFEILDYKEGNVEVLFYENVKELPLDENEEDEARKYSYDLYRLIVKDRPSLYRQIESKVEEWLKQAKEKENETKVLPMTIENQNRADIDYISVMTGVDL